MTTPAVGFITREDESVKAALGGLLARDPAHPNGSPVRVRFRLPEDEAEQRVYPYVVIDFLNARRDPSREHRGTARFRDAAGYNPFGLVDGERGSTDYPIPMLLDYQITAYSRFYQHDRQIVTQLMQTPLLQPRFGALEIVGDYDDNSVRRVDLLSGPTSTPERDADGKRVFRTMWEITVSSEYFQEQLDQLTAVGRVVIDLKAF